VKNPLALVLAPLHPEGPETKEPIFSLLDCLSTELPTHSYHHTLTRGIDYSLCCFSRFAGQAYLIYRLAYVQGSG
jgi:hypothetical protein